MANPRRIERLQQLVLRTVATCVQRDVRDPRVGIVSVTRVKLSPDLSHAQVYWSCLGSEAERRTTARGLQDAIGAIQGAVASAMQTRVTPRLDLHYDEGMQKSQRMEDIFRTLREERGEPEPAEGEDEDDDAPTDADA